MPRLIHCNPTYRRHRASGQAIVTIHGRDYYLGPWRSVASRAEYDRLIAEYLAAGRQDIQAKSDLTVAHVVERFWTHVKAYYRRPDGTPTGEAESFKTALRPSSGCTARRPPHRLARWRWKLCAAK